MSETGIIPKARRAAHGDYRGYVLALAGGRLMWKEQADHVRDTKREALQDAQKMVGEYALAYHDFLIHYAQANL